LLWAKVISKRWYEQTSGATSNAASSSAGARFPLGGRARRREKGKGFEIGCLTTQGRDVRTDGRGFKGGRRGVFSPRSGSTFKRPAEDRTWRRSSKRTRGSRGRALPNFWKTCCAERGAALVLASHPGGGRGGQGDPGPSPLGHRLSGHTASPEGVGWGWMNVLTQGRPKGWFGPRPEVWRLGGRGACLGARAKIGRARGKTTPLYEGPGSTERKRSASGRARWPTLDPGLRSNGDDLRSSGQTAGATDRGTQRGVGRGWRHPPARLQRGLGWSGEGDRKN